NRRGRTAHRYNGRASSPRSGRRGRRSRTRRAAATAWGRQSSLPARAGRGAKAAARCRDCPWFGSPSCGGSDDGDIVSGNRKGHGVAALGQGSGVGGQIDGKAALAHGNLEGEGFAA